MSPEPLTSLNSISSTCVALLVGVLLLVVRRWGKVEREQEMCYRVREIPANTTKADFLDRFNNHLKISGSEAKTDMRLTFACSSSKLRVATFISHEKPPNLGYLVDTGFLGVTPLSEADDAVVDIIAVPGLGSHAIGGFKAKSTGKVWLRDFLPDDINRIAATRIMTYGYDSAVTEPNAKYSIKGLAKAFLDSYRAFREATNTSRRPIIFIGHSLGGLLIKECLSIASEIDGDPQYSDFFKSSFGLMFFGVPNYGLRGGKLKEITAGQLNEQIIRDLEADTESEPTSYLRELAARFIKCSKKQKPPFQIRSYYEQRKTRTVEKLADGTLSRTGEYCFMVTEDSACRIGFKDRDHDKQPLALDHSDLVKFSSPADDSYVRVLNTLNTLVGAASDVVDGRFSSKTELSPDEKRCWRELNKPDYKLFKNDTRKLERPVEGTLRWLIHDQESEANFKPDSLQKKDFITWRDSNEQGCLLVIAAPGQGKSVLSNFVVDNLLESINGSENKKVIYYFCNVKEDVTLRTASTILRTLIVQLCEDRRLFLKLPIGFRSNQGRDSFHLAQFDDLWTTFNDLIDTGVYSIVYCVIDGLDVYETGINDLLYQLKALMDKKFCRLRLFCTSRPSVKERECSLQPQKSLRTPEKDLQLFIQARLGEFSEEFNADMKNTIQEAVMERKGTTFLWISIFLRKIKNLRYLSVKRIEEEIKNIPQELDELYNSLVQAIFSKDQYDVAIMVSIAYSKRPLALTELETAAALIANPSINRWEDCLSQKIQLREGRVRENLGTLVDLIDNRLYLIHQSLRDFLLQPRNWQQEDMKLKIPDPERALGKACITYLSFEDFEFTTTGTEGKANKLRDDGFFDYTKSFWHEHFNNVNDIREDDGDVIQLQRILRGPNSRLLLAHEMSICDIAIMFDAGWLANLLYQMNHDALCRRF
ncbi:hypothetical protein QQS21_010424 [Conoideocrella luteorostrata]|uniref:Nephrocystin 3-like N-terminal domain-containing protein n=1 Tax=Conoideocrella luteorostrata TaxID=1105319 RepID=A0AAJ0CHD0_9HYPO|nr:hypothetical protein QQS21_010424 [Conoideocrella luteorostrata]